MSAPLKECTELVRTDILHVPARVVVVPADAYVVLEELSLVSERRMIIPMTTTGRRQQRYDHRLRHLVQGTGDVTIATDLGSLARRPVGGSARRRRSW